MRGRRRRAEFFLSSPSERPQNHYFNSSLYQMATKNNLPPQLSPCDTEKLKLCLEEHDGDGAKCSHLISAFKQSCGREEKKEKESPLSTIEGASRRRDDIDDASDAGKLKK